MTLEEQVQPIPHAAPRVLVAEDNLVNQTVTRRLLEERGFRADVVGDGLAAVSRVRRYRHYAAVLMDCRMPGMDGWDATREIRRLETDGRHLPVIALTASAHDEDRTRCIASGMDDFMAKPLRRTTLREMLDRWVVSPVGA
jgi:CheY-like chemotaxis protein